MNVTMGTFPAGVSGAVACVVLVTLGCAAGMPRSGFLNDYSGFEKIHDDAPVWSFVDPEGVGTRHRVLRMWSDQRNVDVLGKYDRFMNEPLVVRLNKHSPGHWVSPDKLKRIVNEMDDAFERELTAYYPKVDRPGEGVIRFRAVITDIWPAFLYDSPQDITALEWVNSRAGGSTIEAEAVDSVSGERVFAVIVSGRGSSFDPLTVEERWNNAMKVASGFGRLVGESMKEARASN